MNHSRSLGSLTLHVRKMKILIEMLKRAECESIGIDQHQGNEASPIRRAGSSQRTQGRQIRQYRGIVHVTLNNVGVGVP